MLQKELQNRHRILSAFVIVCGLLYIFAYQFTLPFKTEFFLYGMLIGLVSMFLLDGHVILSTHFVLFLIIIICAFIGVSYTSMSKEGLREAILFAFFGGVFVLSLTYPAFIQSFTRWIYFASLAVVLSSIVHFLFPNIFNDFMRQILRDEAYEQLIWSYTIDETYPGISAYTPNTTFSAAIVFGYAFLDITNKNTRPIIKSKQLNIALLTLSLFSIILCSKRGIFVATIVAMFVLVFYLYRGRNFILKFGGFVILLTVVFVILYRTNEFVATFLDRFTSDDFMTGRDAIYESLIKDFKNGNILIGQGTGATYKIAVSGAHNIYLQLLYEHGIIFSLPYFVFLLYNYQLAFRKKCPLSIYVQTIFLIYGMSGNPLYSNMFMMIYLYHVLYAARMSALENTTARSDP